MVRGLVALATLVGRAAGPEPEPRAQLTYVSAFEEPRLSYTLNSIMREPGAVLELSRPAYAMELVGESCAASETVELRELLFLQSVALATRVEASGITMLYAGMADGRFIGYYSPERYTFRAAEQSAASSPDLVWSPYTSPDDVPDALSSSTKSLAASCPGSARDSAGCTPAGCCDSNIRAYYSTSVEARGAPQSLTRWALYDPRLRPWYIEELGRSGSQMGWSSVYVFAGSGNLGITRTAKMARDSASTELHGVLAVDFELGGLSRVLNDTLTGGGSWAFIVERSGSKRGKLIATSFGAALSLDGVERSDMSGLSDEGAAFSKSIAAVAGYLDAEGLPATTPGQALTNTVPGRRGALTAAEGKFEAITSVFELGGLDWLVVVGQDIACAGNEVWDFGTCKACPEGQVPGDDRSCVRCNDIHPGTISDAGIEGGIGTRCVCPPLTYAVRKNQGVNECKPCAELADRVLGVPVKSAQPINWESTQVCPGGVLEVTRICPVPKLWIETLDMSVFDGDRASDVAKTRVDLLTCPACLSGGCVSQLGQNASQPSAVCTPHHKGFMCADCEEGYRAVEGQCTLCIQTDWSGITLEVMTSIAIGLFLMSKTWNCVCSPANAEDVFKIMDSRRNGYLSVEDVRKLLIRMGNPVAASKTFDKTLAEMKAKKFHSMVFLRTRTWFPRWLGGMEKPNRTWVEHDSVSRMEFIDWCTGNQNRATVGTFIFAIQTFGLVIKNSTDVRFLEIFNLDVAKAVKSCRSPQCGLFCGMMSMAITPVCAGIAIYIGMYFMATKAGKQTSADGTVLSRGLPMRWHHLQRGYMQLYLFSFAPITRRCAELLSCRTLPKDASTTERLVTDLGMVCWEGPHVTAASFALFLLTLYVVVVPTYLLIRTARHMRTRLPSPQGDTETQRASPLTEERAVSVSQNIGRPSICSPRSFLSSRSEGKDLLDPATLLLVQSAPTLNPTCWDELVKATKPEKYWWFIFILLLKLLVNVLFLIGQALEYNWGMWLQITLVLAALLSHFQKPYVLQDDNQQEQLSFLGLVLVLSVTNSGVVYAGSWLWYHVVVVGAVVGALTFSVVWVHYTVFKTRAAREQRVARGEKGLKQFTRQAFATVVPTFLLLTQHERDAIRAHIQVETFESGEVIYEEGDPAQAFFIIKEGTVKLQTTHKDTDARLVGERDAFGAGALAMESQHCSATAIAVSANVVCLRLIRDDWMRLWPPVTETVARELFSKLDFDHSGQIELVELEGELMERWRNDPEMSSDLSTLVQLASSKLMNILDANRDGTVTFEEFRNNLRKVPHDDLSAGSSAPPVLRKGDWVRIVKEGTHRGELAVVSDPEWTGRVKVTRQSDQTACSYLRSEVIKESTGGDRTERTSNPLAGDPYAAPPVTERDSDRRRGTAFEVESVPYGVATPSVAQRLRLQASHGASTERQRNTLSPPPVAPRPTLASAHAHGWAGLLAQQREQHRTAIAQRATTWLSAPPSHLARDPAKSSPAELTIARHHAALDDRVDRLLFSEI